ncbi:MAG: DUF3108 domain-containing protein [Pseudohongiellaceae bacterium]
MQHTVNGPIQRIPFSTPSSSGRWWPLLILTGLLSLSGTHADGPGESPDDSEMLSPYEAEYEARSHGLSSTASRTLHRPSAGADANIRTYRLTQSLSVRVLGANLITLQESSHFAQSGTSLIGGAYRYEQTGISRRNRHIRFNWLDDSARVTTRDRNETYAIERGTLDQLAFTAQLRLDVRKARQEGEGKTDFTFRIIDEHGPEEQLYRLAGSETLETPIGSMETVRLERIREPDSPRTTTVWLAPSEEYIMVRLLQTEEGESDTELLLSSLVWTEAEATLETSN